MLQIWYNQAMNPPETTQSNQITPDVAEKKVSAAVEDIVEDDDFLIEEDGDFFWVIQRISWGIIKTLMVLAIIGALVWLIWGGSIPSGDNNPPETLIVEPNPVELPESSDGGIGNWFSGLFRTENTQEKEPKETPTPIVSPPKQTQTRTAENNLNIEDLAYQLADQNINISTGSTIETASSWLKQVKIVGDISTDILRASNPNVRADRIEQTIRSAEDLLNQSPQLQRRLSEEFDFFLQRGESSNQNIVNIDEAISQALLQFQGAQVETLLNEKITQQQAASANLAQAKVRQTLLKNVQNFDRLLRQKSIPLLQPTELRANSR